MSVLMMPQTYKLLIIKIRGKDMEFLYDIFYVFYSQVMTKAPLLLGLVTCLGYILLRRDATTVISGSIKTIVGFMIVQVGSGSLVAGFAPVIKKLNEIHGLTGSVIDPYTTMMAMRKDRSVEERNMIRDVKKQAHEKNAARSAEERQKFSGR